MADSEFFLFNQMTPDCNYAAYKKHIYELNVWLT